MNFKNVHIKKIQYLYNYPHQKFDDINTVHETCPHINTSIDSLLEDLRNITIIFVD